MRDRLEELAAVGSPAFSVAPLPPPLIAGAERREIKITLELVRDCGTSGSVAKDRQDVVLVRDLLSLDAGGETRRRSECIRRSDTSACLDGVASTDSVPMHSR
jgi:hypothetical protein